VQFVSSAPGIKRGETVDDKGEEFRRICLTYSVSWTTLESWIPRWSPADDVWRSCCVRCPLTTVAMPANSSSSSATSEAHDRAKTTTHALSTAEAPIDVITMTTYTPHSCTPSIERLHSNQSVLCQLLFRFTLIIKLTVSWSRNRPIS